jgi:hypothetical protein
MSARDAVDCALRGYRPTVRSVGADSATKGADHGGDVTIGLDIARSVFQVHGVDAARQVVVRSRLRRFQRPLEQRLLEQLEQAVLAQQASGFS